MTFGSIAIMLLNQLVVQYLLPTKKGRVKMQVNLFALLLCLITILQVNFFHSAVAVAITGA